MRDLPVAGAVLRLFELREVAPGKLCMHYPDRMGF